MSMPLTSSEIEHIASAAAKKAVHETLLMLGVDASEPDEIKEMQRDFAHLREFRQSIVAVRRHSWKIVVGILLSGVAGAVMLAFKSKGV
jgi:hypothetical protein